MLKICTRAILLLLISPTWALEGEVGKAGEPPCWQTYRIDTMQRWTAPHDSILCNAELRGDDKEAFSLKISNGDVLVTNTFNNFSKNISNIWLTDDSQLLSVFVYKKGDFMSYLTFKYAETEELQGLVAFEQSTTQGYRRTVVYISKDHLKITSGGQLQYYVPLILIVPASAVYFASFYIPVTFFSSVFFPAFYMGIAGYQGRRQVADESQLLVSSLVALAVSGALGVANQVYKKTVASLLAMLLFLLFCVFGAGVDFVELFIVCPVLFFFIVIYTYPRKDGVVIEESNKAKTLRSCFMFLLASTVTVYTELSWSVFPSELYQRIRLSDFGYSNFGPSESLLTNGIGCVIAASTSIILVNKIRKGGDDPDPLHFEREAAEKILEEEEEDIYMRDTKDKRASQKHSLSSDKY